MRRRKGGGMAAAPGAWVDSKRQGDELVIAAGGEWTVAAAPALDASLRRLALDRARTARFELGAIDSLDSAGAWLIWRTRCALDHAGIRTTMEGLRPQHAPLFAKITEIGEPAPVRHPRHSPLVDMLARIGRSVFTIGRQARQLIGFLGAIVVALLRLLYRPGRIRFTSLVSHLEQVGLNALPILGLLSFLVGIVLAYQGVDQLRKFGAEIFTVNLVGVSVLREMGILLTAIIVAGRSGSAFTAQIGTMQVNEEVDALRTLGLDPIEVLVLPRVLALIIAMPLLTFFANVMAILGGGLMTITLVDVPFIQFLRQLNAAVSLSTLWVGMSKAPVFAFIIAMVGCFEGLQVTGSAESVGRLTTQSVVESIFLVIVFDAVFSILFSYIGF
jgi:phospholipid/cholesterol/gamma-HCH transport system permease protein